MSLDEGSITKNGKKTTIWFKSKTELDEIYNHAKQNYNLPFSKYVRLLIKEDMKGERRTLDEQERESEIIKIFQIENNLLQKEVKLLGEQLERMEHLINNIYLLNQNKTQFPESLVIKEQILNFFTGVRRTQKFSPIEIATALEMSEEQVIDVLNQLCDEKHVRLYSKGMKYGRID